MFIDYPSGVVSPDQVDQELAFGVWHHVGLAYGAHDSEAIIYIDGIPAWTKLMSQLTTYLNFPALHLGQHYYSSNSLVGITASLACVKVYARMLAGEEISMIMNDCSGILLGESKKRFGIFCVFDILCHKKKSSSFLWNFIKFL